jgi:hypothetical protein
MLIKKNMKREKKKQEEDIPKSEGEELGREEKRKKERDVDVFYIRGRKRRTCTSLVK